MHGAIRYLLAVSCCLAWGVSSLDQAADAASNAGAAPWSFTLADGDRVVFLGGTLVEREQSSGYLETALTSRFPGRKIEFRNLGWSGDSVLGDARAGFGTVTDGFAHLKEHVLAIKPTVIFVNYGANESFGGKQGLAEFRANLEKLLAVLDETQAQLVFLTPPAQEDMGRPLPDPAAHNRDLKLYGGAISEIAARRSNSAVDLFELLGKKLDPLAGQPLTDNGIHLTDYGYWRAAIAIESALGLPTRRWQVEIDAQRGNIAARGATVRGASVSPSEVRFQATDAWLSVPPPPADAPRGIGNTVAPRVVRVFGLAAGNYALSCGDDVLASGTALQFAAGVKLSAGPDHERAEQLRKAIVDKNRLYFYRWRPQNDTYLFGFRKHEQGQNAVEIPQFDPLVAEQESTIHTLSVPVARSYRILRVSSK